MCLSIGTYNIIDKPDALVIADFYVFPPEAIYDGSTV